MVLDARSHEEFHSSGAGVFRGALRLDPQVRKSFASWMVCTYIGMRIRSTNPSPPHYAQRIYHKQVAFRSPDGLDAWLRLHDLFPATHAHAQGQGREAEGGGTRAAVVRPHICVIGSRVRASCCCHSLHCCP